MIDKEKAKARMKKWKDDHEAKGLCRDCNRKAVPGKKRCQVHIDYRDNRYLQKGV